jgi:hypothetical protein
MKLTGLSDAQLRDGLKTLCSQGRVVLARLLAHLVEVEERRLHLEAACPSMLQFCVHRLGMSEDEACRRIQAARLVRRFPELLVRIERGELTLSTIALLKDALTEATYEELVEASAGKTKAEVQALLAKRSPKPDVPAAITPISMQPAISARDVATLDVARVRAPARGSSSITSSRVRMAARASSGTSACAAAPTTGFTPSRRSASSTSSARSARARASADTLPRGPARRPRCAPTAARSRRAAWSIWASVMPMSGERSTP